MKYYFPIFFLLLTIQPNYGQVDRNSDLFTNLKAKDSLLFDRGFNFCEINKIEEIISDDLEFYHDQGGLTNTKSEFLEAFRSNICGNSIVKPIRKLIDSSLEVYPLFSNGELYGAIQKGEHEFYLKEQGKPLRHTSIAKFTHVWLFKEDQWILKKVLSYDHQSPNRNE